MAHEVLRCNVSKIMETAKRDIKALARNLYQYGVLTHDEYDRVFDRMSNMTATERANEVINSVMKATKHSGEAFDKFLQSLLECGLVQLQDTLLQCYSMLISIPITLIIILHDRTIES